MMKNEKKNKLIVWWLKYMKKYVIGLKKCKHTDYEIWEEINRLIDDQMYMIEEARPDKTKDAEKQMNDYQREYYQWLKKVKETGKLEYDL